ncbi:MAG: helix-turn-helix domain-containing protein [Gammaproteobacteria bacterium]|nr:helix-turn-helix domain-containing protein [Gammaproteobacteria bacterium]
MSRAAFSAAFRELVGDTPMHDVTRWRMQMAVDLLTSTSDSMARIAEQCGTNPKRHFATPSGTPSGSRPAPAPDGAAGCTGRAASTD